MSGGIPTPSPKSEGGTPSPLVLRKTGYLPPSGCLYRATTSHGVTPERVFLERSSGGWYTPSLPYEWGGTPSPSPKSEGGSPAPLPPLLPGTGYHPLPLSRERGVPTPPFWNQVHLPEIFERNDSLEIEDFAQARVISYANR